MAASWQGRREPGNPIHHLTHRSGLLLDLTTVTGRTVAESLMTLICIEERAVDRAIAEAAGPALARKAPFVGSQRPSAFPVRPGPGRTPGVAMPEALRLGVDLGAERLRRTDEPGIGAVTPGCRVTAAGERGGRRGGLELRHTAAGAITALCGRRLSTHYSGHARSRSLGSPP
ncbi:hypothetical protein [Micromonospora antibiotica]|uniref:Uncharacterized protein n=1 Tax=Micromonospora antibiotica TaxID=2807623 RepID=A0ABS3VFV2_9ACTN|nr:hypothetical protein [Micromonospora antibiotica]MBO4164445.1 hypothetical protein [Micromonospora antibiotica]